MTNCCENNCTRMIFYKMQNLQRKEALNQKVEENKPVLELKNTGKKVCQNIWKELFWFYPPCQCALTSIHLYYYITLYYYLPALGMSPGATKPFPTSPWDIVTLIKYIWKYEISATMRYETMKYLNFGNVGNGNISAFDNFGVRKKSKN